MKTFDPSRKLRIIYSNSLLVTTKPARLTGDESFPCDFVIMSITNTIDDLSDTFITRDAVTVYDESNEEIYWGHDGVTVHQLFPKQTTDYIPVCDARDIFVRCSVKKAGNERRVGFSLFKYDD